MQELEEVFQVSSQAGSIETQRETIRERIRISIGVTTV